MGSNFEEINNEDNEKKTWTPIFRQLLVTSSAWMLNFLLGMAYGLPTVMIPQIRKDANSTEAVSPEMASWLYSVFGYSALPWVVILCVSTRLIGRKIPFSLVCLNMFACYNLLYFSTSLNQILIADIMQGLTQACNISLNIIIVLEYVAPKHRGIFITIKSANFFWGIWVANAIGTFYHWRYIPLIGIFLALFSVMVTIIFWPESPQWLASKGRYDKCKEVHRWLRGTDKQSEKELQDLIQSQIDYIDTRNDTKRSYARNLLKTIRLKSFYKPMLLSIVLMMQYNLAGKTVLAVYAIDIIKGITASESTAYMGMLMLDGVTIVALYTGCVLSKVLNRRTLLLLNSLNSIIVLLILSLYLFLTELGLIVENKIATLVLLTLFSVFICCGPIILLTPIAGELTPLRYKSSITMISAVVFLILTSTTLKLFPVMCNTFHMSGTFLFYAVSSLMCCTVLYLYVPETKDKTLQEIEHILLIGEKNK